MDFSTYPTGYIDLCLCDCHCCKIPAFPRRFELMEVEVELIVNHLSKQYGNHQALRDVSLRCNGELVGLVGPNGAGKTTLMRILATLIPQSEGTVIWNGKDTRVQGQEIRKVLGYLP